jgi:hypothetical protein
MDQNELLQLGDLNLAESHREISRWNPNTDMAEQGDILFVCGANTFPAVNFVIRVGRQLKSSPDKLISQAKDFLQSESGPLPLLSERILIRIYSINVKNLASSKYQTLLVCSSRVCSKTDPCQTA